MVARTPQKQLKMVAPLNPILLRETIKKMERCMDRLEELQCTVTGGKRVVSGVSRSSPHGTKGCLRTIRSKQDSLRINKNAAPKKSPVGKFPTTTPVEWRRMSLPAMLLGETVGEILQASQFAREIVASINSTTTKTTQEDPKTPITDSKNQRPRPEGSELKTRRKREKQNRLQLIRSENNSPSLQRARSRINFKISPPRLKEFDYDSTKYLAANRVSPRNRPWVKKTVLFPNPLFLSSSSSQQQKFSKTKSPVIARKTETPHKFLIKSPQPPSSKFQVKIKNPPLVSSISPTRSAGKKSPKAVSTAAKLRRSFSPSRLATRLVSPLKSMRGVPKIDGKIISGLKQRPNSTPVRCSTGRI